MALKSSKPVTIPATQAHRGFGDLIRRVYGGQEHFIIEKDGLPVAVVLSITEYEQAMGQRDRDEVDRQERLRQFREATRAMGNEIEKLGLTEADLDQLVEETRQQLHDSRYRTRSVE